MREIISPFSLQTILQRQSWLSSDSQRKGPKVWLLKRDRGHEEDRSGVSKPAGAKLPPSPKSSALAVFPRADSRQKRTVFNALQPTD